MLTNVMTIQTLDYINSTVHDARFVQGMAPKAGEESRKVAGKKKMRTAEMFPTKYVFYKDVFCLVGVSMPVHVYHTSYLLEQGLSTLCIVSPEMSLR